MSLIHLTDRSILRIVGNEAKELLQSIITQDVKLLQKDNAIYGAILTPHGRIMHDFFAYEIKGGILLDCNKDELMDIAKIIHKFALGKQVDFEDLSDDYNIYADLTEQVGSLGLVIVEDDIIAVNDPRLGQMGKRIISPVKLGSKNDLTDYEVHRIDLGIVDCAYDGIKNKTLPLELGLDKLNGISFDKGCYVGQELTARTHFRGGAKKQVFVINAVPESDKIMADEIEAGWVFSKAGGKALTIVRSRYLGGNNSLTVDGEVLELVAPTWWTN